ncbi:MAG TPA: TIGR01777 family oxidoreductase [Puia sp.]|nr:TIGR01777 family oxidoreductase [Puia sp.]
MATVLITGGTGLVGRALSGYLLDQGWELIILTRDPDRASRNHPGRIRYLAWDPAAQTIDPSAIREADFIIHLAGAGVAERRWTKRRKREIVESRVNGSRLLQKSLREIPHQVRAVISASAIGWYGPDVGQPFVETDPPATDFLGETCRLWEDSIDPITEMGIRLYKIRTGIVLSTEGGAMPEFLRPLRFGFATILGSGKQVISWIHVDDLCRIYRAALDHKIPEGIYNAVAPLPVSNKDLVMTLARIQRGRFFIPFHVPAFVLKLLLGEMSIEVLKSAVVSAEKLQRSGFQFLYPTVEAAIPPLLSDRSAV